MQLDGDDLNRDPEMIRASGRSLLATRCPMIIGGCWLDAERLVEPLFGGQAKAQLVGGDHRLRAVTRAEYAQHGTDVNLDRALRKGQFAADQLRSEEHHV